MRSRREYISGLIILLLVLVVASQIIIVFNTFARPALQRTWNLRGLDAPVRSAYAVYGEEFSDYIDFVREKTPEDATILISPNDYRNRNLMSFFLVPRMVITCSSAENDEVCVESALASGAYVLGILDFPSAESRLEETVLTSFPGSGKEFQGVYFWGAEDRAPGISTALDSSSIAAAVSVVVLMIAAYVLLGAAIVVLVTSAFDLRSALILGFPLGAGLVSWAIFIISWLGVPISTFSILVTYIVLLILVALSIRARGISRRGKPRATLMEIVGEDKENVRYLRWIILAGFAVYFLVAAVIAIGASYSAWDPIAIWAVKGYGIGFEGSIFAAENWGEHGLEYLLAIPMQISIAWLFGGDLLPGSKILFPLFSISLLAFCYFFWRRRGVSWLFSALGAFFLATLPIVFEHSTAGYTNLAMTYYLLVGLLIGIEGVVEDRPDWLFLSGLFLGLAAWTRVEGILYASIILMFLSALVFLLRRSATYILYESGPFVVLAGVWFVFFRLFGGPGSDTMDAVQVGSASLARGEFNSSVFLEIYRFASGHFTDPSIWGFLVPAGIVLGFFGIWRFHRRRDPYVLSLAAALFLFSLVPLFLFYFASFAWTDRNFSIWIPSTFARQSFPPVFLFVIFVVMVADAQLNTNNKSA